MPETCTFDLINGLLYGPESTAELVQQNRYFGYDDCIFAGELAYLVVDFRDVGGNFVPFSDTDAFYDLLEVSFEQGSEFSIRDGCWQYGDVSENLVICKIRPLQAGSQ